jgi:hypothetical protein
LLDTSRLTDDWAGKVTTMNSAAQRHEHTPGQAEGCKSHYWLVEEEEHQPLVHVYELDAPTMDGDVNKHQARRLPGGLQR